MGLEISRPSNKSEIAFIQNPIFIGIQNSIFIHSPIFIGIQSSICIGTQRPIFIGPYLLKPNFHWHSIFIKCLIFIGIYQSPFFTGIPQTNKSPIFIDILQNSISIGT
jgi:hypothetical protein